ncbi:penicillin-binding transpeptidase domain-containing protein [Dyadobacter sp. CY351]|uniref:penicillin-binding transpeptidase domain-containing protein n=1 Tax=Dyadobacter sp. CY351 TaxID=2909337 RepID=UPI001F4107C9|nr:penicillin-binding transpeptidase domain-containing protein [Dyadobacter sp. CY351]MCF2520876.1 penicillin binding protein transpeptidase domain-containing protein [Dyadobacter sp. CY351]
MKILLLLLSCILALDVTAQNQETPFQSCNVKGSTTIYDYNNRKWTTTDEFDSREGSQPASTFKVINLLIALETGVIENENDIIKWPGTTDTTLYGYRPDIYRDISVKEAFELSAGWAFIELAKQVGREKYKAFLRKSKYGNGDLSEQGDDFWNFGKFAISPRNQIEFLIDVYENKTPFSEQNIAILKKVMVTEHTDSHTLRSKTGWTRVGEKDIGWWVGYLESKGNVYFFATRLTKLRSVSNPGFGECRKTITKEFLTQLMANQD